MQYEIHREMDMDALLSGRSADVMLVVHVSIVSFNVSILPIISISCWSR